MHYNAGKKQPGYKNCSRTANIVCIHNTLTNVYQDQEIKHPGVRDFTKR